MARRIRTKEHHSWVARDGRRAVLAAILLTLVVAMSISDGRLIPDFSAARKSVAERPVPAVDDLRTGSILITPADGNLCEHRIIDNDTWRIRRNGTIACDKALGWAAEYSGGAATPSRIEAVRDSFFPKR